MGKAGILPQPQKLLAIRHWPPPTNVSETLSFLGICGFYVFCGGLRDRCGSAHRHDAEEQRVGMAGSQVARIRDHESSYTSGSSARAPDHSKPYILHTDASDVGVGETLSQMNAE